MKKYFIFLVILFAGLTTSCNDLLELEYDGRSSLDELFKTRTGVMGYLNSCYGSRLVSDYGRASLTDEAQDANGVFQGSLTSYWYVDGLSATNYSNTDGQPWDGCFQGIRKCNIFLERMKDVTANGVASLEDEVTSWVAQAHALRALYYLQLIKRYGAVPLITTPYETTHDYGADVRTPVSAIMEQILADCDAAMSAPAMERGFSWSVRSGENGIMNRAVVQAIRSQAILYAASPLYTDGVYSWSDAVEITGNALSNLLVNGYELFQDAPAPDIAQNAYALYFITRHDEQRAYDKETIYFGNTVAVWANAGMPSTPGQSSAGPCPTQELVDCYEMQATGQIPVSGYSDPQHLNPIINTASGYDPENPYEGRDPRFYASVYYNGAVRQLGQGSGLGRDDHFPLGLSPSGNNISITAVEGTEYHIETTGGDPYVATTTLGKNIEAPPGSITLRFKYKSNNEITNAQFFFMQPGAAGGQSTPDNVVLHKSAEWTDFALDLNGYAAESWWHWGEANHALRFDVGADAGNVVDIKDMEINVTVELTPAAPCESYVGGVDGLTSADRRTTKTSYYLRKYNNWKSSRDNSSDGEVRTFRLTEMYLNFAEAAYQASGNPDAQVNIGNGISMSARDAVNAIRRRADMPDLPAGLSKDEFERRYRNERRIELAFEDHRYFDVRRWQIMESCEHYVTGMRITQAGSGFNYERISYERDSWKEKLYFYPIPQSEVNKMQDQTGVNWQNPGWN